MNNSPLRYPGGKSKLFPLVDMLIEELNIVNGTYIEPFVGGGGLALSLLYNQKVSKIIINDYDCAIYSIWYAILNDTQKFFDLVKNAELNIEEWRRQKDIYNNRKNEYSIELAFATFYLNRTNRSGILKAGPIGGYSQNGDYKIGARFNKDNLVNRILEISKYKNRIELYNLEIRDFINMINKKNIINGFIYFDPPYYNKGKELYTNFFDKDDHLEIYELISNVTIPWMITYDDVDEIRNIYINHNLKKFDINYSVANKGKNSEIIGLSSDFWPSKEKLGKLKINIR